ncbi:hypothetical protein NMY22_g15470 [Coprinellus aureogranulatus]|nr:hypothetical protein NMY22_g15470 [Coprinellus aureogranulatus]
MSLRSAEAQFVTASIPMIAAARPSFLQDPMAHLMVNDVHQPGLEDTGLTVHGLRLEANTSDSSSRDRSAKQQLSSRSSVTEGRYAHPTFQHLNMASCIQRRRRKRQRCSTAIRHTALGA